MSSKPQKYVIVRTSKSQTLLLSRLLENDLATMFPERTETNISRVSVIAPGAIEQRLGLCRLLFEDAKLDDEC